ncbi:hypothetical protein HPB47_020374 [Ixodes persulcatus]|uniref:Uncharacterized protein n=1 Tax=Ixodes persulcatus TaxID=34615 RepID=A0AC60QHS4_IXOPE|nr:hypothetical protein HPB47_020374 [Ixodes persulcatus]
MRRFGAFRLLDITHIKSRKTDENDDDDDGMWFECVYPKKEPEFRLKIRALPDRISLTDIKGFDNTGNVCIWPSEEVLAYYCMKNKEVFVRIRWDENEDIHNLTGRFDVIIAADCLFFDDGRVPLVNTIWKLLRDRGLALILAPKRGTTFQQFVDLALEKFEVEIIVSYDTYVWDLHDKVR